MAVTCFTFSPESEIILHVVLIIHKKENTEVDIQSKRPQPHPPVEMKYNENVSQYISNILFFFKTFIMGELWFRTDNTKHSQTGRKLF